MNQAYCRFFNQTPSQLIGSNGLSLVYEDDREALREHIAGLSPAQSVSEGELRVLGPDGHVYWFDWTARGVFDEQGQLIEVQSVGRDITERKLTEEAERVRTEQLYQSSTGTSRINENGFFESG